MESPTESPENTYDTANEALPTSHVPEGQVDNVQSENGEDGGSVTVRDREVGLTGEDDNQDIIISGQPGGNANDDDEDGTIHEGNYPRTLLGGMENFSEAGLATQALRSLVSIETSQMFTHLEQNMKIARSLDPEFTSDFTNSAAGRIAILNALPDVTDEGERDAVSGVSMVTQGDGDLGVSIETNADTQNTGRNTVTEHQGTSDVSNEAGEQQCSNATSENNGDDDNDTLIMAPAVVRENISILAKAQKTRQENENRASEHDDEDDVGHGGAEVSTSTFNKAMGRVGRPKNLQRLLADAITYGAPLSDIKTILNAEVDINKSVTRGLRPIHYAAYENNTECVKMLIEYGACVNSQDQVGYTPLHLCAKHGLYETMRVLIENGAHVNFSNAGLQVPKDVQSLGNLTLEPLNLAIDNNHIDCVQLLLESGARPDNEYILGHEINLVPLDHIDCLELLLVFGADPNSFARDGMTPLMKACKEQRPEVVTMLIKYGADVNLQCPPLYEQKTALHITIILGNLEIVQILLDAGAKMRKPVNFRGGALNSAVTVGRYEICKLLIERGADVNELNDEDCPPLMLACSSTNLRNQKEIIQLLLENGADPNYYRHHVSFSAPCLSPLIEYLSYNDDPPVQLIHLLLKYGTRVTFTRSTKIFKMIDPYGVVKHLMAIREYPNILEMLLMAAEKFNMADIQNEPSLSADQRATISDFAASPICLKHLVRCVIRNQLMKTQPLPLPRHVDKLPLPPYLKDYIAYER